MSVGLVARPLCTFALKMGARGTNTMEQRRTGIAILAAAAAFVLVLTCNSLSLSAPPSLSWVLPINPDQGVRALSVDPSTETLPAPPVPWSYEEHALFLQGLGNHGIGWRNYKKISKFVKTRSFKEIRDHAASYFVRNAHGEHAPTEVFGWPSEGDAEIPPGTYYRGGRHRWKETTTAASCFT